MALPHPGSDVSRTWEDHMRWKDFATLVAALAASGLVGCAAKQQPAVPNPYSWAQRDGQWGALRPLYPPSPDSGRLARDLPENGDHAFDFEHPRVDDFLTQFQTRWRNSFSIALSRSGRYVPRMSSILAKEGVPAELVYLPLIESGFKNSARSPAGAVGPWQFIPGTGRRYGLRIDRYVDERRDPIKSTRAAARYLRDLYGMFGDWHLALAGYNTGENRISGILSRSDAEDFWEMSERGYLCRETSDYVPKFLAALQIAERPEDFEFDPPVAEPLSYDVVEVDRSVSLSTVATLIDSSPEEIKELNPALHQGVTPPDGYQIRLPKGAKEGFKVAYAAYADELEARAAAQRQRALLDLQERAVRSRASAGKGRNTRTVVAAKSRRSSGKGVRTGARAGAAKRTVQTSRNTAKAPIVVAKGKARRSRSAN